MPVSNVHSGEGSIARLAEPQPPSQAVKIMWSLVFLLGTVSYNYTSTRVVFPTFNYPGTVLFFHLCLSIVLHIPISILGARMNVRV